MAEKVYKVYSTYRVTGVAYIVASSAAEAARIGTEGYPDGGEPQFEFSEPWGETRMVARTARGARPSPIKYPPGMRPAPTEGGEDRG